MRCIGTASFRRRASLIACVGLAACVSYLQATVPAPRSQFVIVAGGSVTISRFEYRRTRLAIVSAGGAAVNVVGDSAALATLADWAEHHDSARISDKHGASVLLTRAGDAYVIQASQAQQSFEIPFAPERSRTLLAILRGAPVEYPNPPLGLDRIATVAPDNPRPPYPKALRKSKTEGTVSLQFFVDTTGLADLSSIRILQSSDTAFTASVIATLPRMRFVPATAAGRKVRELINESFSFTLGR